MWDLPRPGLEPVCPALAGRFSTTAPPGKPPRLLLTGGPHPQHVPPTRDPRRLHQEEEAKKELPLLKGHFLEFTCSTSAYTPPTRTQSHGPWEIGSFLSRVSITTAEGESGCWGSTGLSATFHKHLSSAYSFVFCIFLLFFW